MMIQVQEPKSPWEIVHMDWLTALPPGGGRSYNECLLLVDRNSKTPMFLQFCKDDTSMDTAIMIWNKDTMQTDVCKILSNMQKKDGIEVINHLTSK
ncbi:hypothetical protein O181_063368 [Austropuccinia psidii MF-1]|uniref:Uncharacterized protein n=1 Tax=Austropuccinia psidii MF-1 TaxID=1389203 RepID=A0A9Q3EL89_9BASI|nr:hypothetical protein [Austropuccinia psidii MF-1]